MTNKDKKCPKGSEPCRSDKIMTDRPTDRPTNQPTDMRVANGKEKLHFQ